MKVCFIGHRDIPIEKVTLRLKNAIIEQINAGCNEFYVGNHGDFDKLVLNTLVNIKSLHPNIIINLILTNLNVLNTKKSYNDIINTMFFDIENLHFKQRIIYSNKKMINICNVLICYVNMENKYSNAYKFLKYAQKNNLHIINIFDKSDNPILLMPDEEFKDYCKSISKRLDNLNNKHNREEI